MAEAHAIGHLRREEFLKLSVALLRECEERAAVYLTCASTPSVGTLNLQSSKKRSIVPRPILTLVPPLFHVRWMARFGEHTDASS